MKNRLILALILILVSGICYAKKPPSVQFMNVSPMPGGGYALNNDGIPDGLGAVQLNIPIAYTPGKNVFDIGAYAGEYSKDFSTKQWNNGSGMIGMGLTKWPRVFVSAMAVSSWIANDSKALSFQFQPIKDNEEHPAFAFGVQDVLNKEWKEFRNRFNTHASYYGVATHKIDFKDNHSAYITLGNGAGRFLDNWFGGVSVPINDSFNACLENDGFQWNEALFWRPQGRQGKYTLTLGRNNQCGTVVGAHFTGKLNRNYSVPIFLFLWLQDK